jgi:hypothetical protein
VLASVVTGGGSVAVVVVVVGVVVMEDVVAVVVVVLRVDLVVVEAVASVVEGGVGDGGEGAKSLNAQVSGMFSSVAYGYPQCNSDSSGGQSTSS